jgi:hypothetical protein
MPKQNDVINTKLRTNLLDTWVERSEADASPYTWPAELKPNASGEYIARVVAAWVDVGPGGQDIRLAVVDPFGHTGFVWFKNIRISPTQVSRRT